MSIYPSSKVLPYVYQCVHKITGKIYIGSRTNKLQKLPSSLDFPNYRTSSKYVKPIFEEFDWFIVAEFFDPHDAYDFEQQLIHEQWQVSKEMSLNGHHQYGKPSWNFIGRESHRKGKNLPEEHIRNLSNAGKGKPKSKEHNKKNSESQKGKILSESHKQNIKEAERVEHSFLTPDGFVIENITMKELCSQFNLKYGSVVRYFREQRSYKGFIRLD